MSIAENFRSDWWLMDGVDHDREILLSREQKEIWHEMILQECQEGKKSSSQIADEFGVHKSTVCRIARKGVKERLK